MAENWIRMRLNLVDDPAVIEMAEALGIPEQCVVGYLHTIWCWASKHCNGGTVTGVTPVTLGRVTRCERIPELMVTVGWLETLKIDGRDAIRFPNWDRWLSQSSKARALTARRVETHRKRKCNGASVTKALPDKIREDKIIKYKNPPISPPKGDGVSVSSNGSKKHGYTPQFEEWYKAYPRKVGKGAAFKAFLKAIKEIPFAALYEHTKQFAQSQLGNGEYCPHPSTWLNGRRWEDDHAEWDRHHGNGHARKHGQLILLDVTDGSDKDDADPSPI